MFIVTYTLIVPIPTFKMLKKTLVLSKYCKLGENDFTVEQIDKKN